MKEIIIFNTSEDIIFQIEMMSYNSFNDQIANMNENLGDIYSYKDVDEMKVYQIEYEKRLSYQAIQQLQQENKEKQDKLDKVEEKNKALMLLLEWMTECDFGLDNIFNEEDINMTEEQFEKATKNMEYNESLIYYAELYLQIIKGEDK